MLHYKSIRDATVTAQIEVTAMPPREYDAEEETIHAHAETAVDASIFSGFQDFNLDLSCLSNPPSPEPSTSDLHQSTSSPSNPPSPRSVSFASPSSSPPQRRSPTKLPSPRLSPVATTAIVRGSWPLVKYVGRGTPVDRNRRIEWGGLIGEDVAEDGVLFSTVRSASLDSAVRPSRRSVSPEWNYLSRSSTHRSSTFPAHAKGRTFIEELPRTPEIQIEGLNSDHEAEWASIMQTVLQTSESASQSRLPEPPKPDPVSKLPEPLSEPPLSPEAIQQLDPGLEMDLGINQALDLGLGLRGGMNWFDLGMLPASGRESPSVYSSQPQTPRGSPPPSIGGSDNRSATSTKADANTARLQSKVGSQSWWWKVWRRLRRMRAPSKSH